MQVMSELIPVNVVIADRSYRLRIHPKDEEVLRKTIKTINEKIVEFRTQFAGKDMQKLGFCHVRRKKKKF